MRAGLHTGTPHVGEEGYVGHDVHRAARIAAAGHGGQVVVSSSTAALVTGDGLLDLGEHRFKDLGAPERVYQLGNGAFPPLKSLYRTNLPVPATPFLGRERELAEVVELLSRDGVRLVTLTGPGGTGKTRLALQAVAEASDRFPDGVFWVPLAPLVDDALVLEQAAQAVGSEETLVAHVGDKRLLLLLDNFEHLLGAAPGVGELLAACPNLVVVVTSRELLQLQAEYAYSVPTLDEEDGVALFLARAGAVTPDVGETGTVAELCARLDNLPLALELAASRTRHLTPEQLLERLSERLDLLKGGRDSDPRQQTLRATIEWSFDLLDRHEQDAFARLSVFSGGWTLEAAEEVADTDLDTLASLVDKSLVRRTGDRFWMLETIREFAAGEFAESDETGAIRRRHAEYYLRLGESLGLTMENLEIVGAQRHDVAAAEQDNFRAAIDWASGADLDLAVRIAFSLENFWVTYSPLEGRRLFETFLERAESLPPDLHACVLRCSGNTTRIAGDREAGIDLYRRALERYREIGDERGTALMDQRIHANPLAFETPHLARPTFERLLVRFRELGMRTGESQVLGSLALLEESEGDFERAQELLVQAADLARSVGFTWTEQYERMELALVYLELGRLDDAKQQGLEALRLARRMGDRLLRVASLAVLARVAVAGGALERAGLLWGAVEAEEERSPLGLWEQMRQRHVEVVLAHEGPELDRGRAEGRRLALEDAIDEALADA